MVPRRPPFPCCWTAPPGGGCQDAVPPWLTADPVPDLQPPGVGSIETPPGWHGLLYVAPSGVDP